MLAKINGFIFCLVIVEVGAGRLAVGVSDWDDDHESSCLA